MTFQDSVDILSSLGPRLRLRGVTGRLDENGAVNPNPTIGLDDGFCWVRLEGERTAIAVLNLNVTTQRANVPVILEQMDNGQLQVLQVEPENAIYTYGKFAPSLNAPDRIPEQEKGSVAHKRIQDLRLRKDSAGGLNLYVNKGVYRKADGTLENFDGGPIDLTASLPGTADTKRIVLVGLDSSNALTQSATTAIDAGTSPTTEPYFTLSDFVDAVNAASTSVNWLWAVPLLNGQTEFLNTDTFQDLRPIMRAVGTLPIAQGGTGAVTATAAFNALSPLTTKADLLSNDGSNDVRVAAGSTNGMTLVVDSSTASGLAWTATGSTFQATVSTTDATVTTLVSYAMTTNSAVTIQARIIGVKSDYSAALVARVTAGYVRAAGSPALIGTGDLYIDENSTGAPLVTVDFDAGTNTARIRVQGVAAENWSWKAQYTIVGL